ncbi:hypothetical protein [Paenibacillus sp. H1-7]|uniref:hypothetical protein n=1 Tax=Paenibacillus sp. H1-7 TaxID=2282849 RepID=UPI001EF89C7D|nr:hypothetical protein [Paenibacillus sp. H1-7]
MKDRLAAVAVILILYSIIALAEQYRGSFDTIEEAIRNQAGVSETLQVQELVPAFQSRDHALYFGVNSSQSIVGVYLTKTMFGWRVKSRTTGTGMELTSELQKPLGGGTIKDNELIYGLANANLVQEVRVNGTRAAIIPIDKYLPYPGAEGKAVWYLLFKKREASAVIEAFDYSGSRVYPSP